MVVDNKESTVQMMDSVAMDSTYEMSPDANSDVITPLTDQLMLANVRSTVKLTPDAVISVEQLIPVVVKEISKSAETLSAKQPMRDVVKGCPDVAPNDKRGDQHEQELSLIAAFGLSSDESM